tara:strand:- start:746 stop:1072 length:327 start_codon:yes stop_codon:yes gene_type:complete
MMRAVCGVAAALVLSACASQPEPRVRTETVTVEVPVYRKATPPAWLLEPVVAPDDVGQIFVAPDEADAVLGVTRDGLEQFYLLLDSSVARLQAWRAWAANNSDAGGER